MQDNADSLHSVVIELADAIGKGNDVYSSSTQLMRNLETAGTIDDTTASDAEARIIKAHHPLFIPQFPELRGRYRERIESKLQQLEDTLAEIEPEQAHNSLDCDKNWDEVAELLRKHGMYLVLIRIGGPPLSNILLRSTYQKRDLSNGGPSSTGRKTRPVNDSLRTQGSSKHEDTGVGNDKQEVRQKEQDDSGNHR